MATVKLWTDAEAEAHPKVKAVFDDIRETRKSDFVSAAWPTSPRFLNAPATR